MCIRDRYRRLDSDVDRILGRLEIASSSEVSSRALYGGVRGLGRRLEESEQTMSRLQAIAEQSDIGLVIAAEAGEVVYANPAAQKVLSGRLGDAVAGTRIVALLERVQRTGIEEDLELDLYTPTRKIVGLRARSRNGTASGEPSAISRISLADDGSRPCVETS